MRISDVKVYTTWAGWAHHLLVKVETDVGLYGWGEAGVLRRELAVAGAVRHYRELLLGGDPMRRGAIWQELYRSQYFEGGHIFGGAISAIDIALHDIVGKALNIPVYQLLGGAQRDYVPLFATTGARMGPQLIDDARRLIESGWMVIRFVPGQPGDDAGLFDPRESIALTAEWAVRLREAVGREPVLGIDYHHRLNVAEAVSFCQQMPPGTLDFLEEPIRAESPEAYAVLRSMTPTPLAIGEEFASKWQFLPFIERGLTNFVRLDICNVGGFTEAMKVAGWAEAHYIDVMPHNPLGPVGTAAITHLAAAIPNFAWLEIRQSPVEELGGHDTRVYPKQLRSDGPRMLLPVEPGLGVEVDESLLDDMSGAFLPMERPRFRRRDGSHTNS